MVNDLKGSLMAERSVLGSVLVDNSCAPRVFSSLEEDAFASTDRRNLFIFRAMKVLLNNRQNIDVESLNAQLNTMQLADECDSPNYLFELCDNVVDTNNLDYYINIVRDYHALRLFFQRMDMAKTDFNSGKVEVIGDFLNTTSTDLNLIANRRSVGSFKESGEVVNEVMTEIKMRRNISNKRLTGLDTGYSRLNDLTHGFQPESLNIIAARPSVGKTSFAINLISNAAQSLVGKNQTVAFFSCEMSASSIMQRLLASKSLVPLSKIQLGDIGDKENNNLIAASKELSELPIYFDDTPNQALGDIIAKCEKIAKSKKGKLAAVFIDFLNIIKVPSSRSQDSRTLQIALITSELKEMARRLKIPVIVLAQLNRDADKGTYVAGKGQVQTGPEMSSLKESSSIEQDADTVMMLSRSDWAGKNNSIAQSDASNVDPSKETTEQRLKREVSEMKAKGNDKYDVSIVDISLQKNRNGQTGKFQLIFQKSIHLFSTPSDNYEMESAQLDD